MAANAGRNTGKPRHPMAWQATVGGMIKHGTEVNACCSVCMLWRPVDLVALAVARGESFSLWDKRSTCPTVARDGTPCTGQVFYHGNGGMMSRPLRS